MTKLGRKSWYRRSGATLLTLIIILALAGCAGKHGDVAAAKDATQKAMKFYRAGEADSAGFWFAAATKADPSDAMAWAWRAKCVEYQSQTKNDAKLMERCAEYAREALALDPENAFAHVELAHAYNPQYGGIEGVKEEDARDTTWVHLQLAARFDPADGDASIGLCLEAMRRGDVETEKNALTQLLQNGFLPPSIVEMGAWMLRAMPQNAVLVTAGDFDTFPLWALQRARGLRPDVAVVNWPMLNMPWYADMVGTRHGVPLPMPRQAMDEYSYDGPAFYKTYKVPMPEGLEKKLKDPGNFNGRSDDANMLFLSHAIMRWWAEQKRLGIFARPLAIAVTCDNAELALFESHGIACGTHVQWTEKGGADAIDAMAAAKAFNDANPALLSGPQCSKQDRSMMRMMRDPDASSVLPFNAGIACAKALLATGKNSEAAAMLLRLQQYADAAKLSTANRAPLEKLRAAMK